MWEVGEAVILCKVQTVDARSPMERVATEGCMRQWTQERTGLEAAPIKRKKDHAVPNHRTLLS